MTRYRILIVAAVLCAVAFAGIADAGRIQGSAAGKKQTYQTGTEGEYQAGSTLDVAVGASYNLHGVDSSEVDVLDGVTGGTRTVSKAIVVDSDGDVDALGVDSLVNSTNSMYIADTVQSANSRLVLSDTLKAYGTKTTFGDSVDLANKWKIAGTTVDATATEINLLDGVSIAQYTMENGEGLDTLVNVSYDSSTIAILTIADGDAAWLSCSYGVSDTIYVFAWDTSGAASTAVILYNAFIKE